MASLRRWNRKLIELLSNNRRCDSFFRLSLPRSLCLFSPPINFPPHLSLLSSDVFLTSVCCSFFSQKHTYAHAYTQCNCEHGYMHSYTPVMGMHITYLCIHVYVCAQVWGLKLVAANLTAMDTNIFLGRSRLFL